MSNKQIELKIFTVEQDNEKAEQIINVIMPHLEGATINQIKIAFDKCLENIKLSYIIT